MRRRESRVRRRPRRRRDAGCPNRRGPRAARRARRAASHGDDRRRLCGALLCCQGRRDRVLLGRSSSPRRRRRRRCGHWCGRSYLCPADNGLRPRWRSRRRTRDSRFRELDVEDARRARRYWRLGRRQIGLVPTGVQIFPAAWLFSFGHDFPGQRVYRGYKRKAPLHPRPPAPARAAAPLPPRPPRTHSPFIHPHTEKNTERVRRRGRLHVSGALNRCT